MDVLGLECDYEPSVFHVSRKAGKRRKNTIFKFFEKPEQNLQFLRSNVFFLKSPPCSGILQNKKTFFSWESQVTTVQRHSFCKSGSYAHPRSDSSLHLDIRNLHILQQFASKNKMLALSVFFPQPSSSAGRTFPAYRSRLNYYQPTDSFFVEMNRSNWSVWIQTKCILGKREASAQVWLWEANAERWHFLFPINFLMYQKMQHIKRYMHLIEETLSEYPFQDAHKSLQS